jgi:hypothetical protein
VQGIQGDDALRDLEFTKQPLRGGDLIGFFVDIDVRQNQAGFGIPRVKPKGRLLRAAIGPLCGR